MSEILTVSDFRAAKREARDFGNTIQVRGLAWASNEIDRLTEGQEQQAAEIESLISIYRHYHQNNGQDDACRQCGLDLRNEIHAVSLESRKGG